MTTETTARARRSRRPSNADRSHRLDDLTAWLTARNSVAPTQNQETRSC